MDLYWERILEDVGRMWETRRPYTALRMVRVYLRDSLFSRAREIARHGNFDASADYNGASLDWLPCAGRYNVRKTDARTMSSCVLSPRVSLTFAPAAFNGTCWQVSLSLLCKTSQLSSLHTLISACKGLIYYALYCNQQPELIIATYSRLSFRIFILVYGTQSFTIIAVVSSSSQKNCQFFNRACFARFLS